MNNVSLKDTLPALQSQKTQEGISKHSSGPEIKVEPDTDQLGLSLQYDISSSDKMRKHNAFMVRLEKDVSQSSTSLKNEFKRLQRLDRITAD